MASYTLRSRLNEEPARSWPERLAAAIVRLCRCAQPSAPLKPYGEMTEAERDRVSDI